MKDHENLYSQTNFHWIWLKNGKDIPKRPLFSSHFFIVFCQFTHFPYEINAGKRGRPQKASRYIHWYIYFSPIFQPIGMKFGILMHNCYVYSLKIFLPPSYAWELSYFNLNWYPHFWPPLYISSLYFVQFHALFCPDSWIVAFYNICDILPIWKS